VTSTTERAVLIAAASIIVSAAVVIPFCADNARDKESERTCKQQVFAHCMSDPNPSESVAWFGPPSSVAHRCTWAAEKVCE
jgi:hypothetical protein